MVDPDPPRHEALRPKRHHAVIAGTGRAGTSFLVRFLEHCGLDTASQDVPINARARAGLEHSLFDDDAPYVVKDPWLFAYCDQVDRRAIDIDVLLVPIRELMAASTSRVLQERITMAEEDPWSALPASEVHGAVAGGTVYSLDPVDEARLLAVGFHRLIHWAIAGGIPLILLEFPRIVLDPEYLVDTLWPWLGEHCSRDHALAAFAAVADPDQLRVEGDEQTSEDGVGAARPGDPEELDRAALKVLLAERDLALAAAREDAAETRVRLAEAERRLAETEQRRDEGERRATESERNLATTLATAQDAVARESHRVAEAQRALQAANAELAALRRTWSWRLTSPLRSVRTRSRAAPPSGSVGDDAAATPPDAPVSAEPSGQRPFSPKPSR
jgi:hypothetical protein